MSLSSIPPIIPPGFEWVRGHAERMPRPGPILDLAAGTGRFARLFKELGYAVAALDRDISGLADLAGVPGVELIQADLEDGSPWPLRGRLFHGIVVVNYLHRPILPLLAAALAPGGVLITQTFGTGNERFGRPSNPDFLLHPGELLRFAEAEGLAVLDYHCGEIFDQRRTVRQGLVARKMA
ncbi:MAG TPA: class I SAM-dependent methyltransferase [Dongiaceae bacterium]|jgi:SAM-dependent methyltransferase